MSLLTQKEDRKYVSVLGSDGTLRTVVEATTPGAVRREYENSKKEKGVKYELVFQKLEGKITNIAFWEGDYGRNLQMTIRNGEESAVLSVSAESSFGEDIMKKLPNINLEGEISFEPFSFENDKGKQVRGMSIKQAGKKIQNYYWDAEKKAPLHGLPEAEGKVEDYSTDDWKIHFLKVRKFLVGEVQKLIEEKFPQAHLEEAKYPEDEIAPELIPF